MAKYEVPDDAWEDDEPEGPPAWKEDTSAKAIEFDVQLHEQGYQEDEKWTIHCHEVNEQVQAAYAIKHRNKGNYWREGTIEKSGMDFVDLPLRVRQRAADVMNRSVDELTPEHRLMNREDGTGFADENRRERLAENGTEAAENVNGDLDE